MPIFPDETLYPEEGLYPDGGDPSLGFGVLDIVFPGASGNLFDAKNVLEGREAPSELDLRHALQIILKDSNNKAFLQT